MFSRNNVQISLIFNKLLNPNNPGNTVFSIPDPGIHKTVRDYHLYLAVSYLLLVMLMKRVVAHLDSN